MTIRDLPVNSYYQTCYVYAHSYAIKYQMFNKVALEYVIRKISNVKIIKCVSGIYEHHDTQQRVALQQ